MTKELIRTKGLGRTYLRRAETVFAFSDITLQINHGEFIAFVGGSSSPHTITG